MKLGLPDFPAEIRLRCYRYAFRNDKPLMPTGKRTYLNGNRFLKKDCSAFQMRTSKAFAFEARAVVYGENEFSFDDLCSGLIFLRQIGMENCRYLQYLKFCAHRGPDLGSVNLPAEAHDKMIAVVVDFISYKCPILKSLAIGEVASPDHNDKWSMKTLDQFQDAIKITKTMGMDKAYYSGTECSLLFTCPHVVERSDFKKVSLIRELSQNEV